MTINAETMIVATGRFLSGGLAAERDGVRETLLDLPVVQSGSRGQWYRQQYFDPRGHRINRAGVDYQMARANHHLMLHGGYNEIQYSPQIYVLINRDSRCCG